MFYFFSLFILLLNSNQSIGKDFNYQLKGSFKPSPASKEFVQFTLRWSEERGKIAGEYNDSKYTKSSPVTGTYGDMGRNFEVIISDAKDVRTINLLTTSSMAKRIGTSTPVSIITRDKVGRPIANVDSKSRFTSTKLLVQKQEDECRVGFGALGGYCGVYEGLISEQVDRQNKCNLLYADAIKLELGSDSNVKIYLGEVDEILHTPEHLVGKLMANPPNTNIDISSRRCLSLAGIRSAKNSCKRLNLTGKFSMLGMTRHFVGLYTIFDEESKNTCSYTLSLDME